MVFTMKCEIYLLLIIDLLLISINRISLEEFCGSDDWVKYSDEKCIHLTHNSLTQSEGKKLCKNKEPKNSHNNGIDLVSIDSEEDQQFINKYLIKNNIEDNVWIDLMRVEGNDSHFKSSDGVVEEYHNWALNRPTSDVKKRCVQLRAPGDRRDKRKDKNDGVITDGKWEDVVCYKKNMVLCQMYVQMDVKSIQKALIRTKRQLNEMKKVVNDLSRKTEEISNNLVKTLDEDFLSFKSFENKLDLVNNKTDVALREMAATEFYIKDMIDNPVPIGFVYMQLPGQSKPSSIWPTLEWTDISYDYSGLFFRVLGNGSEPFRVIQADNAPRLITVGTHIKQKGLGIKGFNEVLSANNMWSNDMITGSDKGDNNYYMAFKVSSGEVRPRNTALIVWKRTK